MIAQNRYINYLPLLLLLPFLLLSVTVFFWGPFTWPAVDNVILITFLSAVLLSIVAGFFWGVKSPLRHVRALNWSSIYLIGIVISCILFIPSTYIYTGKSPLQVCTALLNQSVAYLQMQEVIAENYSLQRIAVTFLRAITAPWTFAVLPLGILYWRSLRPLYKVLFFIYLATHLVFSFLRGTDKEIADLILFSTAALLVVFGRAYYQGQLHFRLAQCLKWFCYGGVVLILAFSLFTLRKQLRMPTATTGEIVRTESATCESYIQQWLQPLIAKFETVPPAAAHSPAITVDTAQLASESAPVTQTATQVQPEPEPEPESTASASQSIIPPVTEPAAQTTAPSNVPTTLDTATSAAGTLIAAPAATAPARLLTFFCVYEGVCAAYDGPLMSYFNEKQKFMMAILAAYLSQGYYGLSVALSTPEPFESTYGLGHSLALLSLYKQLTGDDTLYQRSYMYKIKQSGKWDDMSRWSSIFPLIASDIGFPAVPFFMLLLAFLFAKTWRAAIQSNDDVAAIVFSFLFVVFFYIPANNQIALSLNSYFAFGCWLLFWLCRRQPLSVKQ